MMTASAAAYRATCGCNRFGDILQQTCYQQADIRMRSHGLRQLVDNKSVANCQQTCCKLISKTCYPQANYTRKNEQLDQCCQQLVGMLCCTLFNSVVLHPVID